MWYGRIASKDSATGQEVGLTLTEASTTHYLSEEGLFVVRAESSEVTVSQGQDARLFGAIMGLTAEEYNDLERLEIAFDLSVLLKEYRPP